MTATLSAPESIEAWLGIVIILDNASFHKKQDI